MRCLVAIKRVIDPYVNIRLKADGSDVETDHVKMILNPFDEIAVEAALRLRETGKVSEVKVITIGTNDTQEALRQALALGADSAILLKTATDIMLTPLQIAKALMAYTLEYAPKLVLLGKQSIDGDNNQTGQMLAGLLDWAQGTFASRITLDSTEVTVDREVDAGSETLCLKLPAVITTDLRLNEPRYVTLPNVMKARTKPLEIRDLILGENLANTKITTIKVTKPQVKKTATMVHSVEELFEKLKNEAKVI